MAYEDKSKAMQQGLDGLAKDAGGPGTEAAAKESKCALCGAMVVPAVGATNGFRDRLSVKEYRISLTCQKCQDEMFTAPTEIDGEES